MSSEEAVVQLPQKLRQAVEDYLESHQGSLMLTTRNYEFRPYKDKSIVLITHDAYIEWGNLMLVLSWEEHSNGSYDLGIKERYLTVGDMKVFMKESKWFQS